MSANGILVGFSKQNVRRRTSGVHTFGHHLLIAEAEPRITGERCITDRLYCPHDGSKLRLHR